MRSLFLISLLPLLAVTGQHVLVQWVIQPSLRAARHDYTVSSRTAQIDLAVRLAHDDRRSVLREMARELRWAGDNLAAGSLATTLERCADHRGRCAEARRRTTAAARSGRALEWRLTGARVAVAAAVGLVLVACGLLVARRVWGRRRLALGLALAGALLGLGGVTRQVQGALRESHLARVEAQRDHWVTRTRVALRLPAPQQPDEVRRTADALARLGVEGASDLGQVAASCRGACPADRVLLTLGRIYSQRIEPTRPPWIDRWLLWIGATLLALIPAARAARAARS